MNYTQLSLEQAPDIWTPLRFFISAPLFAIMAIILMVFTGPDVLHNRWLPETLAITHLITLGFVSMILMGAVFQLLPVLAGCNIYRPEFSSRVIYFLMLSGVTLFTAGFLISEKVVIKFGLFLLIPGVLIFLVLTTAALFKAKSRLASAVGIRFSISALWIALILGGVLAAGTAWDSVILLRKLTNIHVLWASLGWVAVMIIAISYQVIPMFQVTSEYPGYFKKFFISMLFVLLTVLSMQIYLNYSQYFIVLVISAFMLVFSIISIKLIFQRKKRLNDASLYFWLTGLGSVILCVLVFNYGNLTDTNVSVMVGFIFFSGFVVSIINGMLYKIVPFLVWLHLNKKLAFTEKGLSAVPTMTEVISRKNMIRQYYFHLTALLFTMLSFFMPGAFFYLAMIFWLLSLSILFIYIVQAVRLYYTCLN